MGFLHRNLKKCPSFIKNSCYKSLIVPILEYCCTVWDPHILQDINTEFDKIQRLTARFVNNNYLWSTSVAGLINDLKWQSLQTRRTNLKIVMMYKIIHDLVSIPKVHYLIPCTSNICHHNFNYKLPYSRIKLPIFFLSINDKTMKQPGQRNS